MKRMSMFICAVIVILLLIIIREGFMLAKENYYYEPAIYKNIVVMRALEDDYQSIYGYDLEKKKGFLIVKDKDEKAGISIFNNMIIWNFLSDMGHGDYLCNCIYGYDLTLKEKYKITAAGFLGCEPAIFRNIVVSNEYREDEYYIVGYDVQSGKRYQLASNVSYKSFPIIYDTTIIWEDYGGGSLSGTLSGYDMLRNENFSIDEFIPNQAYLALYGDLVIWIHDRDIWGYDMSENESFRMTNNKTFKRNLAMFGNFIIWDEQMDIKKEGRALFFNYDIRGYDIGQKKEFLISGGESNQINPAIWGDIVIWQEGRDDYLSKYATQYRIRGKDLRTGEEFEIDPIGLHPIRWHWGIETKIMALCAFLIFYILFIELILKFISK